ncbi:MAG: arylsulfatase [Lentisphaerae bacterium]|jgi:arylsulfatase A-like enzyme|nr:arylsulfatase [Lentisphaerota bacterium]MBT4818623.1 arylsulfatase [Lentisphaerota bacterium]MBT5609537.1 arylsulfatase [Lentisphaerota bacterium]MBT7058443.1 arylsulfatase [Lentisphaerota bacterium]MBT7843152.1 arylsulfatase [Lentisphaerota bacterium]
MDRPNVILVMTDDQGYGDLGCTGNPWIETPGIDAFYADAVRFSDFHVSPLCTPTRGGLMTGRRPVRNGAWATTWGRSMLHREDATMADVFAGGGYATAMFGKWHLGDNYPYRPQDRGFQHVVAHKGGGVGQTPDFWGNSYFDDTYFHDGEPVEHVGYCTDVWFEEAFRFIEGHHDQPFFAYIATNAPHSPYLVPDRYAERYRGNPAIPEPEFYGMITNIDENFARLRSLLKQLEIEDNTILIFMTDNGSSGGCTLGPGQFVERGYSAGMRGKKGSYYDGGHRVPFFVRWPSGGLTGGRDIDELVAHVDLLPTFIELCGLPTPDTMDVDGDSVVSLFTAEAPASLSDRVHFLQYRQNTEPPEKWTNAVMTRRWRLVNGCELYDIKADPGQVADVAAVHPDVVEWLRGEHECWWAKIEPGLSEYAPIALGNPLENPTRLDAFDVMGDVAWSQSQILAALRTCGRWRVDIERSGLYGFTLRRWPEEAAFPISEALPLEAVRKMAPYESVDAPGQITASAARLCVAGAEHRIAVGEGTDAVTFEVRIDETGIGDLDAWFIDPDGVEWGAYYVYAEWLGAT